MVEEGEVGELWIRPSMLVMSSYYEGKQVTTGHNDIDTKGL